MTSWTFEAEPKNKDKSKEKTSTFGNLSKDTKTIDDYDILNVTNYQPLATSMCAYTNENIFMNFNNDSPDIMYTRLKLTSNVDEVFEEWCCMGYPDVFIGNAIDMYFDILYNDDENIPNYVKVYTASENHSWKFSYSTSEAYIYIREDLLENYPNLEDIDGIIYLDG
ncbi:MAG: hypothetical protein LUE12_02270 [Ruminococcus sp.]|nr:hypothetical protein [Ruminococcus sp.]